MNNYEQTGYLDSDFRIFHLADTPMHPIDFHFHDFHKILIILQGNVSYCVEGRNYQLCPGDIVFVPAGEVHRPIIHDESTYERIIIYISRDYLNSYAGKDYDLSWCLNEAHKKQSHVLRVPAFSGSRIGQIVKELELSLSSSEYASELYHSILFLELMIQLNRAAINDHVEYITNSSPNQKIIDVIDYLNNHLSEDISIETLADSFFISRYHLMHSFKEETGSTIGSYLRTKRLLLAHSLIEQGHPVTTACYECGFRSYTAFLRSYQKYYGSTPRKLQQELISPR